MLIYDVEIKNGVLDEGEERIEGITYCKGWNDFEGMGIAVIAAYDYLECTSRVFCEDNLDDFQSLINSNLDQGGMIVGFNSLRFDNPLVRAHGINLPDSCSYDLLVEIWKAAGLGPKFNKKTHMGFSLDECVQANFPGYGKTGDGAMAPVMWQRGKIGKVIDYCLADVWLTKMLLDKVRVGLDIISPKDGKALEVERPVEW